MELGTLFYNGFFFPHNIDANIDVRPIRDSADRFTKWNEYTFVVSFFAYPGVDEAFRGKQKPDGTGTYFPVFADLLDDADLSSEILRDILTASGGVFQFNDKGFGRDLTVVPSRGAAPGVSTTQKHLDISHGPHPEILAWEPAGENKAIHITWKCTFRIPECDVFITNRIGEFTYDINWAIDRHGLSTRTIRGHITVAVERKGTRLLTNADQERARLRFTVPLGFQRQQEWHLSDDRTTLDFVIVDTEHPSDSPLLGGIVDMDIDHTISSASQSVLSEQWNVTIGGSISVSKGSPKHLAWTAFLFVVKSRLENIKNFGKKKDDKKDRYEPESPGTTPSTLVMLTKLTITEEIFGRGMSFSLSYKIICAATNLFQANGIWKPVPGSDWPTYRAAMTALNGPFDQRGHAQMDHQPGQDVIISFCDPGQPEILGLDRSPKQNTAEYTFFGTDCPPAKESWIQFHTDTKLIEDTQRVWNKPLGGRDTLSPSDITTGLITNNIGNSSSPSDLAKPVYSTRSSTYYKVLFTGWALRLGYKIPKVSLLEYAGQKASPIGEQHFNQSAFRKLDNCVLYLATWQGEYILEGPPQGDLVVTKPDPRTIGG